MMIRKTILGAMMAAGLTIAGPATAEPLDLSAMSEEDRAQFRAEVRAYLLENPEVIFEAIQILEQRRSQQAADADRQMVAQHAEAIFNDGFSFVGGNPDGDVTVVEFLDYRCGYCKRAHPDVLELVERDPNIRLVLKEFPILGPESVRAGKMALAALALDRSKYAELNDALMSYHGNLTEQVAYRIAGELGYDIAALKDKANSTEIDDQLSRNYQLAQALRLEGTPAFIVGDEVIRGYLPLEDMMAAVADSRAAAQN